MLPGTLYNAHEYELAGITGMCGPRSLGNAESWARQRYVASQDIFDRCLASGACDANGISRIPTLAEQAQLDGFSVEPWSASSGIAWREFFHAHESRAALVYITRNGQALVDALTGWGEDAVGLKWHILMLAGYFPGGYVGSLPSGQAVNRELPAGWWACDPASWSIRFAPCPNSTLQFYPDEMIETSGPHAALALHALPGVAFARP